MSDLSTSATQGDYDLAIVGAGIVGLAAARELGRRHPDASIAVLEREPGVGLHQTGHNSGVIHAGIYYKPGSLKARLCVEGAAEIYEFCAEHGVAHDRCGKVIVALDESELPGLDELERRGRENGVRGLRRLSAVGAARGRATRGRSGGAAFAEHGHRRLRRRGPGAGGAGGRAGRHRDHPRRRARGVA